MFKRIIVIVLDGVGIGAAPDAADYGDEGSNSIANVAKGLDGIDLPYMRSLGLGNITTIQGVPPVTNAKGGYGKMQPLSAGKDTIQGHWEMMGIHLPNPSPTYPYGFPKEIMDEFMQAALDEAKQGLAEGGIPIGSVLVIEGKIVGRGHNRRVQKGSAILHAEMDCFENAGRLKARDYEKAVLYSTLSPCDLCSGTALLYKIPKIVIGENQTFQGPEDYVRSRGVTLEILNDPECIQLMQDFIAAKPELWNEDIGV